MDSKKFFLTILNAVEKVYILVRSIAEFLALAAMLFAFEAVYIVASYHRPEVMLPAYIMMRFTYYVLVLATLGYWARIIKKYIYNKQKT